MGGWNIKGQSKQPGQFSKFDLLGVKDKKLKQIKFVIFME